MRTSRATAVPSRKLAEKAKTPGTESRVVMCTDGDFNLGVTGNDLIKLIVEERAKNITLTTLGFGEGNYNDADMEALADRGNGNYAFIDSEAEADKVLVDKLTSTIQMIAKDVKIQVTLTPEYISRYRLIGYENRVMPNEDFSDDTKDGGEIGAGHSSTAFYEIELTAAGKAASQGQLVKVDFRYKAPEDSASKEFATIFTPEQIHASFDAAPADFRFAAGVIELAEILRKSKHSQGARFDDVIGLTEALTFEQADRKELVELARSAKALWR
jgi:Ca-activated chloride channel family protein